MGFLAKVRRLAFAFRASSRCRGKLTLGEHVNFDAPLIANGRGHVRIGERVGIGFDLAPKIGDGAVTLQARNADARIDVGAHTAFSNNVTLVAVKEITIGERCLIGDGVTIMDSDFHGLAPDKRHLPAPPEPVRIGNNVWLGSRALILKGVTIGDDAVIAAGALVTRDVPPGMLAAGVPAKIIRRVDTGA